MAHQSRLTLLPDLQHYVFSIVKKISAWTDERRALFHPATLAAVGNHPAQFNFICTHNSRRSQLAQVWATVASRYYDLSHIQCFSGGTEVTACHPNTIAALQRAGFGVTSDGDRVNPKYALTFDESEVPILLFSKRIQEEPNPSSAFVAMMCCDEADRSCPFVAGATSRIPLHYVDPKVSDGSPLEIVTYDERCREIAEEMFSWMQHVRHIRDSG